MSDNRDHSKQRKNEHLLKNLPTEVLLKARSTLFSLSGALKPKNDQQQKPKQPKHEAKDKKKEERLKSSRSEPEFSEVRQNKHRSRIDDSRFRNQLSSRRPRPLSVGAIKRYDEDLDDFHGTNFLRDSSPMLRQFDSSEDMCVQSRLVIPVTERLNQDNQMHDINERPRKKLSFREPEIETSGSATMGRSNKLMGINSLTRRPNKLPLRSDPLHASNLEITESDLESQAMRIVRTVGQAFEVCHKMQINTSEQPAPSTSSAPVEPVPSTSDAATSKEGTSDCGASETGAVSTTKVQIEVCPPGNKEERPKHLELLPPPPKKEGRRMQQRTIPTPTINLPDLPECITKVEVVNSEAGGDAVTPLSAQHQLQLLRERLEQQAQQTRAAVAQLLLLRDQLAAEQAARCEAQARTHQLLVHNRELLEHIAALVAHLQEREKGSSRPISAQQLTLLPQANAENTTKDDTKSDKMPVFNGNRTPTNTDILINLISENTKVNESKENNNLRMSPFSGPSTPGNVNGASSAPCFDGMSNEQIQNYLITKFENLSLPNDNEDAKPTAINYNQQFFQNSRAFPNIPPLTNHYSNSDIASLMNHKVYKDMGSSTDELVGAAQAMSVGHSENSLYSTSQPSTSKDSSADGFSSDDEIPFIMPLSHNCTLTATSEDGRVRLIVPVSPSESTSDVIETQTKSASNSGNTLKVPTQAHSTSILAPTAPITRTTSEKVPNRSEMMAVLRSQWTRHTTK